MLLQRTMNQKDLGFFRQQTRKEGWAALNILNEKDSAPSDAPKKPNPFSSLPKKVSDQLLPITTEQIFENEVKEEPIE